MRQRGSILIVSLWILSILTIFAVSLGQRISMDVKISGFHSDRLKAFNLAKAALKRAAFEKQKELKEKVSYQVDALNESWANNEQLKDFSLGAGKFTVSYDVLGQQEFVTLYGLMDEKSKININKADFKLLEAFLKVKGTSELEAKQIAASIIDWRDEDSQVSSDPDTKVSFGAEDIYYQSQDVAYSCKNAPFDCIEELLLVRGVSEEILSDIANFITVYGDGKLNINTAPEEVLSAAIGEALPELAEKIVKYRTGNDGEVGTSDDRWFIKGTEVILDSQGEGIIETKNLDEKWTPDPYLGATSIEWQRLQALRDKGKTLLDVASDTFRVEARAEVDRALKQIMAVLEFDKEGEYKVLAWQEQ